MDEFFTPFQMNEPDIRTWLERKWDDALSQNVDAADPEVDCFINTSVVSIRYAFFTQLLGKIEDHDRDLLCLQKGTGESSDAWDPRSFCTKVVVPWTAENHDVLGNSADPYVNNPLRRLRLDSDTHKLKHRSEWETLTGFLRGLQDQSSPDEIEKVFVRCLASLARRLRQHRIVYPVPHRVSLEQLGKLLNEYLGKPSSGLRPQVLATAYLSIHRPSLWAFFKD